MIMQMSQSHTGVQCNSAGSCMLFFCISLRESFGFLAWMLMCADFSAALESDEVICNIKQVQKAAGVSLWSGEQNIT